MHENINEEVSLKSVWSLIVAQKWLLLFGTIVFAIASLFVVSRIEPEWRASAVIQVGMIDSGVVPVRLLINRLNDKKLKENVFQTVDGGKDLHGEEFRLFDKSLDVQFFPERDTIKVSLRSRSSADAQKLLSESVMQMRQILDEDVVIFLKQANAELEQVRESIVKLSKISQKNNLDSDIQQLLALVGEREVVDLKNREHLLLRKTSSGSTVESKINGDLYVSEGPVNLGKGVLVLLASCFGFLLSLLVVLSKSAASAVSVTVSR